MEHIMNKSIVFSTVAIAIVGPMSLVWPTWAQSDSTAADRFLTWVNAWASDIDAMKQPFSFEFHDATQERGKSSQRKVRSTWVDDDHGWLTIETSLLKEQGQNTSSTGTWLANPSYWAELTSLSDEHRLRGVTPNDSKSKMTVFKQNGMFVELGRLFVADSSLNTLARRKEDLNLVVTDGSVDGEFVIEVDYSGITENVTWYKNAPHYYPDRIIISTRGGVGNFPSRIRWEWNENKYNARTYLMKGAPIELFGVQFPSLLVIEGGEKPTDSPYRRRAEIKSLRAVEERDRAMCFMTYYGLPEPSFYRKERHRAWYWIFAGGTLVVAFGLVWLIRNRIASH
jgi:hypothetical protein